MLSNWATLAERAVSALERLAQAAEDRNRLIGQIEGFEAAPTPNGHASPFPTEANGKVVPYIEEEIHAR